MDKFLSKIFENISIKMFLLSILLCIFLKSLLPNDFIMNKLIIANFPSYIADYVIIIFYILASFFILLFFTYLYKSNKNRIDINRERAKKEAQEKVNREQRTAYINALPEKVRKVLLISITRQNNSLILLHEGELHTFLRQQNWVLEIPGTLRQNNNFEFVIDVILKQDLYLELKYLYEDKLIFTDIVLEK